MGFFFFGELRKVESVGEHVEEVKEGETVVPVFIPNCEVCRDCKSKKGNSCSVFKKKVSVDMPRDQSSRFRDMKGEIVHHFLGVSSFTQYTVVDVTHLVKISPHFPLDKACLLSCGVSTGSCPSKPIILFILFLDFDLEREIQNQTFLVLLTLTPILVTIGINAGKKKSTPNTSLSAILILIISLIKFVSSN